MIRITEQAAGDHWRDPTHHGPAYYNYRLEYVRQVARDATRLLAEIGGDEDTVLASVWIHDRFQLQYHGTHHAAKAAEWASQNLIGVNCSSLRRPANL